MQRCTLVSIVVLLTLTTGLLGVQDPGLPIEKGETTALTQPPQTLPPQDQLLSVGEALDLARNAIDRWGESEDPAVRKEAEQDLDRGLAVVKTKAPDHPWLPYLYAFVHIRQGQSWDAVDQLQKFVDNRDGRNEWKAFRTLGNMVVENFPRLAQSHFQKAAKLKEGEPTVLYGLSRCAANVGDNTEALDYARQAAAADRRQSIEYLTHLARIARIDKEWPTATAAAVDALAIAERDVSQHQGEFKPLVAAEAQYKLVVEIESARLIDVRDPSELTRGYLGLAEYARRRAKIVIQMTKHDVVGILEAAAERLGDDTPSDILEQAVTALTDVGREEDAATVCRRILEKDPANAAATQWLQQHGQAAPPDSE